MSKNNLKISLLAIFVITASLSVSFAFAQETNPTTIPSIIDGISTTYLIAGVAIVGILLQTYKGMIGKSRKDFDINQLVFTTIVGIGASIIVVGNAFQNVSINMNDSALMIFLVQRVLTVMGAKTLTSIGNKFVKKSQNEITPTKPELIDDESDMQTTTMRETTTEEAKLID
ncbi:MAG: hypothetical protein O6761_06925 [Thaumarchaeota archaeon]|nr:hypothetical protein [Nitrososphaerota archaeon]